MKPIIYPHGIATGLFLQNFPKYLPTSFNESLTLIQKVNKVIEELNRIGELTNDVVEKWNQVMEWILNDGSTEAVIYQLNEWRNDGTLATIINDEIFGDIKDQLAEHDTSIEKLVKQLNDGNVYIGLDAGKNNPSVYQDGVTSGNYRNVGIGMHAMIENMRGWRNTAIGHSALKNNKGGYNNVAVGDGALEYNIGENGETGTSADDTGSRNTAVGSYAGRYNRTGRGNTLMGRNAGHSSETGNYNTAVGTNAYSGSVQDGINDKPKNASYNTGIGYNSLFNTNADDNIGIGFRPLYFNEIGVHNIAIGNSSNIESTNGNRNVTIGNSSMRVSTDGSDNTSIGNESMRYVASGNGNTAIGDNSLRYDVDGNDLLSVNNSVAIGKQSRVSGDNQLQLGTSGITSYSYGAVQSRSDKRDKADIRETLLGLSFIEKLKPVDFKWNYRDDYVEFYNIEVESIVTNEKGEKEIKKEIESRTRKIKNDGSKKRSRYHHGLIAQDVEEVINQTGIDFGGFQNHRLNGGNDVLSIGHDELIAPLIKAVQELSSDLKHVKDELKLLKG